MLGMRVAASSIASGTPSRRRQISVMFARLGSRSKPPHRFPRPLGEQLDRRPVGIQRPDGDQPLVGDAQPLA
jgi:hypothetical protein